MPLTSPSFPVGIGSDSHALSIQIDEVELRDVADLLESGEV